MTDSKTYTPVSCDMHSQFELLIMHGSRLELSWNDENGKQFTGIVKPTDIQTKSGAEFLVVLDENDEKINIRLDRIQLFKES